MFTFSAIVILLCTFVVDVMAHTPLPVPLAQRKPVSDLPWPSHNENNNGSRIEPVRKPRGALPTHSRSAEESERVLAEERAREQERILAEEKAAIQESINAAQSANDNSGTDSITSQDRTERIGSIENTGDIENAGTADNSNSEEQQTSGTESAATAGTGAATVVAASPVPQSEDAVQQWDETGYASWYAGRFQGRKTANGEIFDTNLLTAAHKTLPFDTIVKVHNPANGSSVLVRINDRGPFVEDRIIDLSRAAANQLGIAANGISMVNLQIIRTGRQVESATIQLGSFSEHANAIDLIDELRRSGFVAHIHDDGTLFKVVIADVSPSRIDTLRDELAEKGYSDIFVRQQ